MLLGVSAPNVPNFRLVRDYTLRLAIATTHAHALSLRSSVRSVTVDQFFQLGAYPATPLGDSFTCECDSSVRRGLSLLTHNDRLCQLQAPHDAAPIFHRVERPLVSDLKYGCHPDTSDGHMGWQVQIRTSGVVVGHSAIMIWATRLISLLALAASLPLSEALNPVGFDVWVPKILYPKNGTIWHSRRQYDVTWYVNTFLNPVLAHPMLFAGITAMPLKTLPTTPARYISSGMAPPFSVCFLPRSPSISTERTSRL